MEKHRKPGYLLFDRTGFDIKVGEWMIAPNTGNPVQVYYGEWYAHWINNIAKDRNRPMTIYKWIEE